MDEIFGQVEILSYNAREHIVGFLVGRVRTPIGKGQHLTFGNGIVQQRRIMPLHDQPVARAVTDDMGLHTVTHQYILHFGMQVHNSWIGIFSYRHSLLDKDDYASPTFIAASSWSSL